MKTGIYSRTKLDYDIKFTSFGSNSSISIGVDANIKDCQYFPNDNAYLIKSIVTWNWVKEGKTYSIR